MNRIASVAAFILVLATGAARADSYVPVETDGLRNGRAAAAICNDVAASSTWTGHWNTTDFGRMSVCNCAVGDYGLRFDVEAGPIWNQGHAQRTCPTVCQSTEWTGEWSQGTRRSPGTCTVVYAGFVRGYGAPPAHVRVEPVRPVPVHVTPAPRRPTRGPRVRAEIALGGPNWSIRVGHR